MTTGQKIKQYRLKAGLSQKDLGEKLNVSQQMIAQYESDKRAPKLETLEKISDALHIGIGNLLDIDTLSTSISEELYSLYRSEHKIRLSALQLLIGLLEQLNLDGINELVCYANSLTEDDLYKSIFYKENIN